MIKDTLSACKGSVRSRPGEMFELMLFNCDAIRIGGTRCGVCSGWLRADLAYLTRSELGG
jgi:hypothetical protein